MKKRKTGESRKIKNPMNEFAPRSSGEYRITRSDGQQYIGQSCNLGRRQYQHVRNGSIDEGSTFEYQEY